MLSFLLIYDWPNKTVFICQQGSRRYLFHNGLRSSLWQDHSKSVTSTTGHQLSSRKREFLVARGAMDRILHNPANNRLALSSPGANGGWAQGLQRNTWRRAMTTFKAIFPNVFWAPPPKRSFCCPFFWGLIILTTRQASVFIVYLALEDCSPNADKGMCLLYR
jgi:hypothetical protein